MIQIDMPMPEKCEDCIFCDDNCSCVASEYDEKGINVGCAFRTGRRDIRCPLKEQEAVVRCKDCKKHGEYECPITMLTSQTTDAEGFCDEGERK